MRRNIGRGTRKRWADGRWRDVTVTTMWLSEQKVGW